MHFCVVPKILIAAGRIGLAKIENLEITTLGWIAFRLSTLLAGSDSRAVFSVRADLMIGKMGHAARSSLSETNNCVEN